MIELHRDGQGSGLLQCLVVRDLEWKRPEFGFCHLLTIRKGHAAYFTENQVLQAHPYCYKGRISFFSWLSEIRQTRNTHTMWSHLYVESVCRTQLESTMVVARGWGVGEMGMLVTGYKLAVIRWIILSLGSDVQHEWLSLIILCYTLVSC